jgi:hypothetical protein
VKKNSAIEKVAKEWNKKLWGFYDFQTPIKFEPLEAFEPNVKFKSENVPQQSHANDSPRNG